MRIVNSIPRRYFTKEGAGRGGRGKKLHARFVPSDVDAVIYPQSEFIQHFSVASLSPSSPEKSIYALRENEKFGLRLAAFIWNSMLQLSRVNASFSMLEILDKTTHVSFRINFQRERKLKSITSFTFSRDTFVTECNEITPSRRNEDLNLYQYPAKRGKFWYHQTQNAHKLCSWLLLRSSTLKFLLILVSQHLYTVY